MTNIPNKPRVPHGNKPVETASFGDDFAAALDAATGQKVSDQEALDFMNSEEGQHAVEIFNMDDAGLSDSVSGVVDPQELKVNGIGDAFQVWKSRQNTVPDDLMSGQPSMVKPVSR